jgi:hypothetical protein
VLGRELIIGVPSRSGIQTMAAFSTSWKLR